MNALRVRVREPVVWCRWLLGLIGITYAVFGWLLAAPVKVGFGLGLVFLSVGAWSSTLYVVRRIPIWVDTALLMANGAFLAWLLVGGGQVALAQEQQPGYVFLSRLCALLKRAVEAGGANTGQTGVINQVIVGVIYILRALFVAYIVFSLIGVFNAMRNDEDWQTAARTPLLAVLMVGIIEAISHLVGGNAGEGC